MLNYKEKREANFLGRREKKNKKEKKADMESMWVGSCPMSDWV